ncbi:MAG: PEP-CTERM sorting domain-containing protein [Myxococcota bacterium]
MWTLPAGALPIVPFTETFNVDDSNWLDATSGAPTYNATGGPDGSGYISTTQIAQGPPFGTIMFRANQSAGASGGNFSGDWGNVITLTADVRHDGPAPASFFFRFSAGPGNSLIGLTGAPVAANVWTTLTLAIDASNPLFTSGGGTFASVMPNVQDFQIGVVGDAATSVTWDLDNVSIVPEPSTALLVAGGLLAMARARRRS